MRLIDEMELTNIIDNICARSSEKIPYSGEVVLYLLRHFGFRINEVEKLHLWSDLGNNNYAVQTSKKGGIRIVTPLQHNDIIQQSILKRKQLENLPTRGMLEKYLQICNNYNNLRIGSKDCVLHIFRHNRIKELLRLGMTKNDVKTLFALQNIETVNTYANSEIYIY